MCVHHTVSLNVVVTTYTMLSGCCVRLSRSGLVDELTVNFISYWGQNTAGNLGMSPVQQKIDYYCQASRSLTYLRR